MRKIQIILWILIVIFIYALLVQGAVNKEKNNSFNILVLNAEDIDYLISFNKENVYLYGFALEDELTLKNDDDMTYANVSDINDNTSLYVSYVESTFGLNIDYVFDLEGEILSEIFNLEEFNEPAEYLYINAQETYQILQNPKDYHPSKNKELLRVANEVNYITNGEMNQKTLNKFVEEVEVTWDQVINSYYDIVFLTLDCNEEEICSFQSNEYRVVREAYEKNVHGKINEDIYVTDDYQKLEIEEEN